MREKRSKIHSLQNAPKPYQCPEPTDYIELGSAASRHFVLESQWPYPTWMSKMHYGMIHFSVDGVGETFLMPRDNWQDVLAAFIGRKEF